MAQMESVRNDMRLNIRAYNKYMPKEFLNSRCPIQLLRLSHPMDRPDFAIRCLRARLITQTEYQEFSKK